MTDWGSTSAGNARRASRDHEISRGIQGGSGCLISLAVTACATVAVVAVLRLGRSRSSGY